MAHSSAGTYKEYIETGTVKALYKCRNSFIHELQKGKKSEWSFKEPLKILCKMLYVRECLFFNIITSGVIIILTGTQFYRFVSEQ